MNWRSTLLLLVLAAGAALYVWRVDSTRRDSREAAVARRLVLPLPPSGQVLAPWERVEIDGPNGPIRLRAGAGGLEWFVEAPVADRADPAMVGELLGAIELLTREDTLAGAADRAGEFGLDRPAIRVRAWREGGGKDPVEIRFGRPTAVEERYYAQLAGSPDVVVVGPELREVLLRRPDRFRDPRLTRLEPGDVERIILRNAGGEIEMRRDRDRGRWELVRPQAGRANDEAVTELLDRVVGAAVRAFVGGSEAALGTSDLVRYGLAEPRAVVRLELRRTAGREGGVAELSLGAPADKETAKEAVFARLVSPGRSLVCALPSVLDGLSRVSAAALRERRLLDVNPDLVDRIRIGTPDGREFLVARAGRGWVIQGAKTIPAEPTEADRLLKTLNETLVRAFVAEGNDAKDPARAGLRQAEVRVTLASFSSENTAEGSAGEQVITSLVLGPKREDGTRLAKIEPDNVIVALDAAVRDAILDDPVKWQPLRLFDPAPGELTRVEISGRGREPVTIERDAAGAWTGGITPDRAATVAVTLARLRAVRWAGVVEAADELETPVIDLRATFAGRPAPVHLRVGRALPDGTRAAELVDERSGVFALSIPDYEALSQGLGRIVEPPKK